jgi:hypothetical protein
MESTPQLWLSSPQRLFGKMLKGFNPGEKLLFAKHDTTTNLAERNLVSEGLIRKLTMSFLRAMW